MLRLDMIKYSLSEDGVVAEFIVYNNDISLAENINKKLRELLNVAKSMHFKRVVYKEEEFHCTFEMESDEGAAVKMKGKSAILDILSVKACVKQ